MATAKPNYAELKRTYESLDPVEAREDFRTLFEDKNVRENFSFREAGYNLLGRETYLSMHSQGRFSLKRCYEAAGEIGTDAFLDIASQWMYANLYDGYRNEEEFVFTKIIGSRKATNTRGEKVPTYTDIINPTLLRAEHDAFAPLQFVDDWIFTPPCNDRGGILSLTEEAIFDDKVGDIAGRDKAIGYRMGVDREIAAIDCFIDESNAPFQGVYPAGSFPWRYNWKGTVIASYNDNTGTHTWDNLITATLTDWTNLATAYQNFGAMTNPYTGLPIEYSPKHLVVPWILKPTAQRILRTQWTRQSDATTSAWNQQEAPVPEFVHLDSLQLVSTKLLSQRMGDSSSATAAWYLADIAATVQCMEVFPIEVVEAVPMNPDQFARRIVKQWRVANDYAYVVWQPRASVKSTGG